MDRLAFNAAAYINESRISRQMVISELSNMSTPGFKRSYEGAMLTAKAEGAGFESRMQPKAVNTDYIQMKPGVMMLTGRDLDIAMNHEAVLGVTATDGTLAFTRRGDLNVNASGVLQLGNGVIVRGQAGGPITIPPGFRVTINDDGSVYAVNPAQAGPVQPVLIDRLLLRDARGTKLERRNDGLFEVSAQPRGTDIPQSTAVLSVTPKTLEGSNVNSMEVLIRLMEQSRSFEQAINIIKQTKDADESGATMMKPT